MTTYNEPASIPRNIATIAEMLADTCKIMGIDYLDMAVADGQPDRIYKRVGEYGRGESYVYDRDAGEWYHVANSDEEATR